MSIVEKYAPYLHFSKYEYHFPGIPNDFPNNARFRQSNFEKNRDRGWNNKARKWEANNKYGADYLGTDWQTILGEIKNVTQSFRPNVPTWYDDVTRPRDERNIWRNEDEARGFFLELSDELDRGQSGTRPDHPIPIFHDIDKYDIDGEIYVALSYWFFYVLNWYVFITHEGDWEHITLYFRESDFEQGNFPEWIYFSAHNGGSLYKLNSKNNKNYLHWEDNTHPHVYVSIFGHPSYANTENYLNEYRIKWKTWEQAIPPVTDQPWSLYDGAWGDVGYVEFTTGPLGPFFKRRMDKVNPKNVYY